MSKSNPATIASLIIEIEHQARHAESLEALSFILCNDTKKIINYHQAVVWKKSITGGVEITTVSGTGLVNQEAPYVLWLKRVFNLILNSADGQKMVTVSAKKFKLGLADEWLEWSPPQGLWCPLLSSKGDTLGGIWFVRDEAWSLDEQKVLAELCDAYAHAWSAMINQQQQTLSDTLQQPKIRKRLKIAAVILLVLLLLPVRQTVLAPAQIAAKDPHIMSPPVEGVLGNILVEPNQMVEANQPLFKLDEIKFINHFRVAEKTLQVAEQQLRKAGQHAFASNESKGEIAVLRAEAAKSRAELAFSRSLLDQITIKAPSKGIVIFTNKADWIGKPVRVGEKVMIVANPSLKEVDIWLPVSDAIKLAPGSPVKLFLNVAPLSPVDATVKYVSYSATEQPDGALSYLVKAEFTEATEQRIGLQGTAKLYGDRVVLIYYLLWRPLSAVRRAIGI